MNPYEPPRSAAPAPQRTDPHAGDQLVPVVAVSVAAVLALWAVEQLHGPLNRWSPILIAFAIGTMSARAQRIEPKRQWLVLSLALTAVALVVGFLLPLPQGAMRVLQPEPLVLALVVVGGDVVRVKWAIDRQEAMSVRDADQRELFARRDAPPLPKASTAPARFACGACGELFPEAELSMHEGRRRCGACAE